MENRHKARTLAFKALYSWELNKSTVFTDIINIESNLCGENSEAAFGKLIFKGVITNVEVIDYLINQKLEHWDIERLDKVDLSILRLSIYSLYFFKDIPRIVTIDEAIILSKEFGSDKSYRFVNGVLDSIVIENEVGLLK